MPQLSSTSDRVLLVGNDALRGQLLGALDREGVRIVHAETAEEALAVARRHPPKAVVAEVRLQGMSGYELCHELRRELGNAPTIVLVFEERSHADDRVAALLLGADDYLVKPVDRYELLVRLRRILARATAFDDAAPELTRRELEVLTLLADGRNRTEIASTLVISPKTVATHVRHILDKLGARTRAQAVAVALRTNMLPPREADEAQSSR